MREEEHVGTLESFICTEGLELGWSSGQAYAQQSDSWN